MCAVLFRGGDGLMIVILIWKDILLNLTNKTYVFNFYLIPGSISLFLQTGNKEISWLITIPKTPRAKK